MRKPPKNGAKIVFPGEQSIHPAHPKSVQGQATQGQATPRVTGSRKPATARQTISETGYERPSLAVPFTVWTVRAAMEGSPSVSLGAPNHAPETLVSIESTI